MQYIDIFLPDSYYATFEECRMLRNILSHFLLLRDGRMTYIIVLEVGCNILDKICIINRTKNPCATFEITRNIIFENFVQNRFSWVLRILEICFGLLVIIFVLLGLGSWFLFFTFVADYIFCYKIFEIWKGSGFVNLMQFDWRISIPFFVEKWVSFSPKSELGSWSLIWDIFCSHSPHWKWLLKF